MYSTKRSGVVVSHYDDRIRVRQAQKRKLDSYGEDSHSTFKPSAKFQPSGGREWTVSIAIPSSIIADCKKNEQRINAPSRIARALAVFCVDEVIIFDDRPEHERPQAVDTNAYTGDTDPCHFILHLLSYLEAPPFMRKALFPLHPNLALQGLLPSLDMPHHPHQKLELLPYMEGVTMTGKGKGGKGTLVDVGLPQQVTIEETIPPHTRVTLRFDDPNQSLEDGAPVASSAPRTEAGYYWGYEPRITRSLSSVFEECPYDGGYDVSIGTSERGLASTRAFPYGKPLNFNHLLIVFGGPRGLEYAAMNDRKLSDMGIGGPKTRELFDHWVNVLPGQGSRTIRTDEAVFIALTELRRLWSDG